MTRIAVGDGDDTVIDEAFRYAIKNRKSLSNPEKSLLCIEARPSHAFRLLKNLALYTV